MDNLEKVEKLRERATVSYEEAKAALEANNWDLLDAMVALEKAGRTSSPGQQNYSTSYDQQTEYIPVVEKVKEQQAHQPRLGKTIGQAVRNFIRICRDNSFCINHKDENISIPVMLVALLFGVRYSFEGKDDLEKANAFMESAGAAAESLKEGFRSASEENARKREQNQETQE